MNIQRVPLKGTTRSLWLGGVKTPKGPTGYARTVGKILGDSGYFKIRSGNCGINDELYELNVLPFNVGADVVMHTIPSTMTAGQNYTVVVRMQNNGTMPWSETDTFRLGAVGDALVFGPDRIKILDGSTVAPGETNDFTFTMTTPAIGGTYTPRYQMVWDDHQWFGQTLSGQ